MNDFHFTVVWIIEEYKTDIEDAQVLICILVSKLC
jgi:hypothetical protein